MTAPDRHAGCPVCGSDDVRPLVDLDGVPAHVGALWPTREAAVGCPRGDLHLSWCGRCLYVFNRAYDPAVSDYTEPYDNALHFSGVFRRYEDGLVEHLVATYGLRDADVLEIGCGSGHFLGLLCAAGGNRGLGFDPSHDPAHADPLLAGRARVVPEYFSEEHAAHPADIICCRHVLEHVPDPLAFMRTVRAGIGDRDTPVYVEVPNGLLALRRLSVGDLIYEHCSYFLDSSIRVLFALAGFTVTALREDYDGQFLAVEARPAAGPVEAPADPAGVARTAADLAAYPDRVGERVAGWRSMLDEASASGGAVAWGAGAKAVGFFNLMGVGDEVDRVVDLNPRKQGRYLPGTGQPIVAPEDLVADPPGSVLIMNPLYAEEIQATLDGLGVAARVVVV
ncbi:MAG: methyltransferase domain-containing protein [Thermoleophilia bacterium]